MDKHVFGWIEIAVSDMDRAIAFYEEVFQFKISRNQMGELDMGWFPWPEDHNVPGAGGSLVQHDKYYKPSSDGALVYFSCEDVNNELARIEKAGGKIIEGKSLIAEGFGYMALVLDTEGNRIALHSTV